MAQRCTRTWPSAHPTAATTRAGPSPGSHASAADIGVAFPGVDMLPTKRAAASEPSFIGIAMMLPAVSVLPSRGDAGRRGASAVRSTRHILTVQSCDAVARR